MKTIQLVMLLLFSFNATDQEELLPISPKTGKVSYKGVVSVQGQTQNELFTKAK